jgi:uncharacterized membrane protein
MESKNSLFGKFFLVFLIFEIFLHFTFSKVVCYWKPSQNQEIPKGYAHKNFSNSIKTPKINYK